MGALGQLCLQEAPASQCSSALDIMHYCKCGYHSPTQHFVWLQQTSQLHLVPLWQMHLVSAGIVKQLNVLLMTVLCHLPMFTELWPTPQRQ